MTDYQCRGCVLCCIDFRLHDHLNRFLIDRGLDRTGSDVVRVAGSALQLARPSTPDARDFVIGQLELSRRLHDVREICLVNHEGCGTYGLQNAFENANELDLHKEDLQKARAILRERLPGVAILIFFQWLDGRFDEID
jgi:carbonic anhydrase